MTEEQWELLKGFIPAVKCQVVRHDATGYCRVGDAKAFLRSKRQIQIGSVVYGLAYSAVISWRLAHAIEIG